MPKLPALQFYVGDYLRDPIAGCSLAAQGLWLRMLIVMHDSERYGYFCVNGAPIPDETAARRTGCSSVTEYYTFLTELDSAGIPSRTSDGIIYSRRMVSDAKKRSDGAERVKTFRNKQTSNVSGNGSCNADVTQMYTPSSYSVSSSASAKEKDSLSAARSGEEDPNLWPVRPAIAVNPPVDPEWPARIARVHSWYEGQMGAKIQLTAPLQRLWFEWFKAGHDEDQLHAVFRYLRGEIGNKKRNDGALKLSNMLDPERFASDFALVGLRRKAVQTKVAPVLAAEPKPPPSPEAVAKGKEQMAAIKASLTR